MSNDKVKENLQSVNDGKTVCIPQYSEDSLREKAKDEKVSARNGFSKRYSDNYDKIKWKKNTFPAN